MSTSMREALEKMVARFSLYLGPNEIHAGQHDKALIAEARAALSSPAPDRLSEEEPVAWQWKHYSQFSGNVVWREQQFWNGHRSTERRALYTSPRLDREAVEKAMCCPDGCLREDDCRSAKPTIRANRQIDAIMRETRS